MPEDLVRQRARGARGFGFRRGRRRAVEEALELRRRRRAAARAERAESHELDARLARVGFPAAGGLEFANEILDSFCLSSTFSFVI